MKCYYCDEKIEDDEIYYELPNGTKLCIYCLKSYEKVNDDSDYLYDIYEDDRLIELEKESD